MQERLLELSQMTLIYTHKHKKKTEATHIRRKLVSRPVISICDSYFMKKQPPPSNTSFT
jgi:hypothetical protein